MISIKPKLTLKSKKLQIFQKYMIFLWTIELKGGVSENNFQKEINENREELFNNYYFKKCSKKYYSL